MDSAPGRRGPIDHLAAAPLTVGDGAVIVRDHSVCGKWVLRGKIADPAFFVAAEAILDLPIPREPNTTAVSEDCTVLWLGPSEWLCVCANEQRQAFGHRLLSSGLRITDIGDGRARFALSGHRAIDLLRKGTTFDVGSQAFPAGRCASTLLARIGVVVHHVGSGNAYDIYCDRGFAEYLFLWFADAAAEFAGSGSPNLR